MYIAADIGGTNGRVALFGRGTDKTPIDFQLFQVRNDFEADMSSLTDTIKKLIGTMRHGGDEDELQGIGIAVAGSLKDDVIMNSGNLSDWVGKRIMPPIFREFGGYVRVVNDAAAAALAEATHVLPHHHSFWFVIWGTGVGGALVRQRVTWGHNAHPSELGHMCIGTDLKCPCKQVGCLEASVGGAAIERLYGLPAAQLGDREWEEVFDAMTTGIMSITTVQPVETIVLGGGVALGRPGLVGQLQQRLEARLKIVEAPILQLTQLGDNAGLLGALASAKM